jgi:hypothetical protein
MKKKKRRGERSCRVVIEEQNYLGTYLKKRGKYRLISTLSLSQFLLFAPPCLCPIRIEVCSSQAIKQQLWPISSGIHAYVMPSSFELLQRHLPYLSGRGIDSDYLYTLHINSSEEPPDLHNQEHLRALQHSTSNYLCRARPPFGLISLQRGAFPRRLQCACTYGVTIYCICWLYFDKNSCGRDSTWQRDCVQW